MAVPALWHDRALELRTHLPAGSPLTRSDTYDYDQLVGVLVGLLRRHRPTVVHTLDPDPDIQTGDEATRKRDSEQPGLLGPRGPHRGRLLHLGGAEPLGVGRGPGRRTHTGVHHDRLPRLLQPALAQEPPAAGAPGEGRPPRPVRRGPDLAVRQPLGLRRLRRRRRPAAHQPQGLGALHPPPLAERGPGARPGAGRLPHRVRGARAASGPLARDGTRRLERTGRPRRRPARARARLGRARRRPGAALRGALRRTRRARRAQPARAGAPRAALPRRPVPRLARAREPGAHGRPRAPGRCPGGRRGPRRPGPSLRTERGQGRLDPGAGGGRGLGSLAGAARCGGDPGRARGVARRHGRGCTSTRRGGSPYGTGWTARSGRSHYRSPGPRWRRPGGALYYRPPASGELLGPEGDAGLDGYGGVVAARSSALGTVLLGTDADGRVLVRAGGRPRTRTTGPSAVSAALHLGSRRATVVGLGADGHPWSWRP